MGVLFVLAAEPREGWEPEYHRHKIPANYAGYQTSNGGKKSCEVGQFPGEGKMCNEFVDLRNGMISVMRNIICLIFSE